MNQHVPQAKASLECPEHKRNCDVTFEVNVFRGASKGGLEVTNCSELSQNNNETPCAQDCIHTTEAQHLHDQAIRNHQKNLSTIGADVIG